MLYSRVLVRVKQIIERFNDKNNMDPIYHDFKIQVLSALTGTPIVQCCQCQDPDCPMSVSDIDTQSVASPPGAAPALPTCSTPVLLGRLEKVSDEF